MSKSVGIVLVDDNDLDLMIGERLISVLNSDIAVKTFNSGNQLIDWLNSEVKECIAQKVIFFFDIYMPTMNGFELANKVQEIVSKKGCNAECYLLSATIDSSDIRRIEVDPKIKGFIGKPITKEVLLSLVNNSKPMKVHENYFSKS